VADGKPFPLSTWGKVIAVNLTGTFNVILFPRRMGRPQELAQLVCSIVTNPYINAACLHIDAGARMSAR
jgi:hypothetical protein